MVKNKVTGKISAEEVKEKALDRSAVVAELEKKIMDLVIESGKTKGLTMGETRELLMRLQFSVGDNILQANMNKVLEHVNAQK